MLVVPFVTKNGINEPFEKTNRLLGYCLRTHPGGPSFLGLAPAQNVPTRIGSGRSMPCGRTSATASRRRPANTILTSKLLANNRRQLIANNSSTSVLPTNARRPIIANNSLTSVPPTNARRPSVVNGYSTRRLHFVSALSMRRLLVASWLNALLLHD